MMALRAEGLLEEGQHVEDFETGPESFNREGGRGYLRISAFLKPRIRRHHPYSGKSIRGEDVEEDGMTPRGFWHYRRSSVMLRMMEMNAKLEE